MSDKVMKLFCFTYAGGNAGFYDQLDPYIAPEVQLVKLEYAGRNSRRKEPFYNNFCELAADMYAQIKEMVAPDEKYSFMGYSMGSISAVEVLRKIVSDGVLSCPCHIFLAAHEPQTKSELADFMDKEADKRIKERTIRFGAVPAALLDNRAFWRVYLPLYRADYTMIGKYRFEQLDLKSDIPATVFYSETDTPLKDMEGWRTYFTGTCEFFCYEGTHFFIKEHAAEMAQIINARLTACCED